MVRQPYVVAALERRDSKQGAVGRGKGRGQRAGEEQQQKIRGRAMASSGMAMSWDYEACHIQPWLSLLLVSAYTLLPC